MTWLDMPGSHVWSGMDRDTIKSVSTYFGMGSNSEAKVTSTPYGTGMYPHFYKWLGTDHGGTESRRTHRKWPNCSLLNITKALTKTTSVLVKPKKWRGTTKKFPALCVWHVRPTFKFVPSPLDGPASSCLYRPRYRPLLSHTTALIQQVKRSSWMGKKTKDVNDTNSIHHYYVLCHLQRRRLHGARGYVLPLLQITGNRVGAPDPTPALCTCTKLRDFRPLDPSPTPSPRVRAQDSGSGTTGQGGVPHFFNGWARRAVLFTLTITITK